MEDVEVELLGERFRILGILGEGSQGRTYKAEDLSRGGRFVAVKELDFQQVETWKAIELFEREARVLQRLDHPGIPAYVDAFHKEVEGGEERFYLVQEFVDGVSFGELIEAGQRFGEGEAREFIRQVLEILVYLQEQNPPVIHRDIKPSNLMRRRDGSVALIDFGAVQSVMPGEGGGSTVIGTTGYMPVEQLMGRAGLGTDVYALGATVAHLLSGHHPSHLPVKQMALNLDGFVNVSPSLREFLDRMLAPDQEERYANAREALQALFAPERSAGAKGPKKEPIELTGAAKYVAMVALALGFIVPPLFFVHMPLINAKARGYYDVMMAPLQQCAIVEEMLGEDPRFSIWGDSSGGARHGSFAVRGSRARGHYSFSVSGTRGAWRIRSASLSVDGEYYRLADCERR